MDKLFENIKKNYKQIKDELVPLKGKCPGEELLRQYVKGMAKENKQIEEHLLSCSDCLETVRVIKMLYSVECSPQEVPERLHRRVNEILQNELKKSVFHSKESPEVIARIAVLWDKVCNKIIRIKSEFGDVLGIPFPVQELQPVRKIHKDAAGFPDHPLSTWKITFSEGELFLNIERSLKEGYISLKTSFQPKKDVAPGTIENILIVVKKANRVCSCFYFDTRGEALIGKLKEGEYSLAILAGERSLGIVELSVQKGK